jgi:hypothetical protein
MLPFQNGHLKNVNARVRMHLLNFWQSATIQTKRIQGLREEGSEEWRLSRVTIARHVLPKYLLSSTKSGAGLR